MLRCAPHHGALVVARPRMTCAVAISGLATAFVLDVTPSAAEFTSAVRARIRVRFDSVPHSRRLDALLGQPFLHLAPLYNEPNR